MNNNIEEYTLNNKCPSCGASIKYNPKSEKWDCEFCKNSFSLDELKNHDNVSNEKNNFDNENNKIEYVTYKCKNCGAEIITDEQTTSTFCIYCRNTTILKSKLSGEFKPDFIIPFKKEKNDAIKAFKNISKGRPLTPKSFNNELNIEKIRGVYIPFRLYDITVTGNINFNAKKIEKWTSGDTHYTKTSNYKIIRDGIITYNKIPIDASTRFNDDIMNSIEPFSYRLLVEYNDAYLFGYYAEKYDIDSNNLYPEIEKIAIKTTTNGMINSLSSYSNKVIIENNLKANKDKEYYALLPVWMVNVIYKNKKYLFAMNGQTGKFIGNIPIDKKKLLLYSCLIFIISYLVSILISYIIYRMGV